MFLSIILICELLLNGSKAETMGLAGKEKVESRFTWKRLAEKTEKVYYQLIN